MAYFEDLLKKEKMKGIELMQRNAELEEEIADLKLEIDVWKEIRKDIPLGKLIEVYSKRIEEKYADDPDPTGELHAKGILKDVIKY
jgi:hypothetical protein